MPQLPNSSTEDLGADDEVKEYKQEDGEDSENGAHLDLVNDIKSDLIKKETENSEVSNPYHFFNSPAKPCSVRSNCFAQVRGLLLCFAPRSWSYERLGVDRTVRKRRAQSVEYRIILFGKIVNKLLFFLPKGICRPNSWCRFPPTARSSEHLMEILSWFR